jgi:hypothetical protein
MAKNVYKQLIEDLVISLGGPARISNIIDNEEI